MLQINGVTKQFGGLTAVDNVDFTIDESEIVGLIGPNGAGKTTLFNVITGVYSPNAGTIRFKGKDIASKGEHVITREGISRTFQTPRTFNELTVIENAAIGPIFANENIDSKEKGMKEARRWLEFVGLGENEDELAGNLTVADRKALELARALGTGPSLILADEIGSGLTPAEVKMISDTLKRVRDEFGISVLWIEHIMDAIMGTADRIVVLNQGKKIAEGNPSKIQENPQVQEAYLGSVTV